MSPDEIMEMRRAVKEQRLPFPMFGIECNEGWSRLYTPLLELCKRFGVEVHQVKEKFGTLRFYVGGIPEQYQWLEEIIDAMEGRSSSICEDCGTTKWSYNKTADGTYVKSGVTTEGGWLRTLCTECRKKNNEKLGISNDANFEVDDTINSQG